MNERTMWGSCQDVQVRSCFPQLGLAESASSLPWGPAIRSCCPRAWEEKDGAP